MCMESVMSSKHFILCCPCLLPLIFSSIRSLLQWVSSLNQVAKYWSYSFSIGPSAPFSPSLLRDYYYYYYFMLRWLFKDISYFDKYHIEKSTQLTCLGLQEFSLRLGSPAACWVPFVVLSSVVLHCDFLRIPWRAGQSSARLAPPQSFWVSRSVVGPEAVHFWHLPMLLV